uniref:Ribosomal protein S13 n=1 Tax=Spumella sp. NIES-1846 TaxID=2490549 RepID=A0A455RGT1_9STRA|nr:ribosomal protein S13 [Spumella sp. NIES-1846]
MDINKILGVNLKNNKQIWIALTQIFGIGKTTSLKILKTLKINSTLKVEVLSIKNYLSLVKFLETKNYILEGNLKRLIYLHIQNLIDIKSYRGIRHEKNLPVRGQRTRTNAKTQKKLRKSKKK